MEWGDEQFIGGVSGLAKEGALTLAVGEELVASAVSLKREMDCWLVRCSQPCKEATEHEGVGHVDTGSIYCARGSRGEGREGTVGN